MNIREIFSYNLKKYRRLRAMSQEELAHLAGIDRTYVSALERQVYSASLDTISNLATALAIEPHQLLQKPGKTT